MTGATKVLADGFGRVDGVVQGLLDGIGPGQLTFRPDPSANTVAWLVWHLARVQDDHVADAYGSEQVWTAQGWAERFDLGLPVGDIGFGHDPGEVDALRAPAGLLAGYAAAVHARTIEALASTAEGDLERVVDDRYDPPVTLCARLVSVIADDLQHAGQAAYVLGLAQRSG